ncbi:MAG: hypothetical protein M3Y71_10575 [Actinomycetota bacterium]|nr:hypothetical protein [Actinomycetota bacterium]
MSGAALQMRERREVGRRRLGASEAAAPVSDRLATSPHAGPSYPQVSWSVPLTRAGRAG